MSYQEWYQSNDYHGFNYYVHCKEGRVESLERQIKKDMDFIAQLTEPREVTSPVPKIETEFECGYDVDFRMAWVAGTEAFWQWDDRYRDRQKLAESRKSSQRFRIELKPQLGDDFPGVLRQMKRNESDTLVVGSFEAKGATLAQVRAMFGNIRIFTLAEIDAVQNKLWPT
jgi:hypothetical protein